MDAICGAGVELSNERQEDRERMVGIQLSPCWSHSLCQKHTLLVTKVASRTVFCRCLVVTVFGVIDLV
jgi:hypothetical protein